VRCVTDGVFGLGCEDNLRPTSAQTTARSIPEAKAGRPIRDLSTVGQTHRRPPFGQPLANIGKAGPDDQAVKGGRLRERLYPGEPAPAAAGWVTELVAAGGLEVRKADRQVQPDRASPPQ